MKRVLVGIALMALLLTGRVYAHHSFAATYIESQKITVEGDLVQFQWRNPHSFVQVEAPDETGQVVRWSIEWGGSGQLTGQGVSRTTLKYGDVVQITANPSRTPNDHKLHMVTLKRASDGFGWGTKAGEVVD